MTVKRKIILLIYALIVLIFPIVLSLILEQINIRMSWAITIVVIVGLFTSIGTIEFFIWTSKFD